MLARAHSFAIHGVDARCVCVEVDIRSGLPAFNIVGLGGVAAREARERVRAAVVNSLFKFPRSRVTANLAPAYVEKSGPGFDLALACGLLAASEQVASLHLGWLALYAELSLGGELRPCPGALAAAEGAQRAGFRGLIVAPADVAEASQVGGLRVVGPGTLRHVAELLDGRRRVPARAPLRNAAVIRREPRDALDLADVRGQTAAIRALIVAAAGGHHLLLTGPPGVGKTMLARRLPSVLPPMRREEAIEVTKIHGVAGLRRGSGLVAERPFRAPHHTISPIGLIGGGPLASPGEAVLAHNGVLFLDELCEFGRAALDALRQPLEDGRVVIVRRQNAVAYPTRFALVAATNPCPCGHAGDGDRCRCSAPDVARHWRKLSGPLLDRLELVVDLRRPTPAELRGPPLTSSADARANVVEARARQRRRLRNTGLSCNAQLDLALLRARGQIDDAAEDALRGAYQRGLLSARAHSRTLRVARTIADLAGSDRVRTIDVTAALALHRDTRAAARRSA